MKLLRNKLMLTGFILASIANVANAQQPVLWQISGNGIQEPSYIMGTLKFTGEKEFRIPKIVEDKLSKCKIFAIEDEVDHHAQHELNKAVHFPAGKSLKTALSKEDYNTVKLFFEKEFKISAGKFETHYSKLIPLALSITMTRLSLGEAVKFYDIELLKVAKKKKLDTYSLEPITREAEALEAYAMQDQIDALLNAVKNFEKQKEEFRFLMKEFPQGDLNLLANYALHPIENSQAFIKAFYSERNKEWLPKLEKMVHDRPAFIAVGISHLDGEQGILTMLREKGYDLTPVVVD